MLSHRFPGGWGDRDDDDVPVHPATPYYARQLQLTSISLLSSFAYWRAACRSPGMNSQFGTR
ncbi:hypothetical protein LN650_01825 [Klebsiella pneumoniae subsp. pneumoniae]|nr:hypothetical protein [Klebsiella pneumoniae subsp. pneumoniae]